MRSRISGIWAPRNGYSQGAQSQQDTLISHHRPARDHLRLPRRSHLHSGCQPRDAHVWVGVVANLEGTRGESSSQPMAPRPAGRGLTHQGGLPVAAGSHSGCGPVELWGHEVEAGIGAGPSHVPVDGRVSHAKGGRVGALHSQWGPQAQGCEGRGGTMGRGRGAGHSPTGQRLSATCGRCPGRAHPGGPPGPWGQQGGTAGHCWSLGSRRRPGTWGCWT